MSDWIKAINPTASITNEAEALRAARASALSIFIGVVVGVVSLAWTLMNPAALDDAVAQVAGTSGDTAAAAAAAGQMTLWLSGLVIVVQLVLGWMQWRNPAKWMAVVFILLIVFGVLSTLAAPMMADMVPDMPVIPAWQIALSVAIMAVQLLLHVAGLRGIAKLDALQMDAAR